MVVGHAAFGEMALHFIEKHGMMAVRIPSKFELRRFCRATGEQGCRGDARGRCATALRAGGRRAGLAGTA